MFKNIKTEEQYNRISQLCKSKNISTWALSRKIGKSGSLFTDVTAGRIGFSGDVLSRIASYFNVSVDYLMNGVDAEKNMLTVTDEDVKKYLFGNEEVTDEMWDDLKAYAEMLILKNKHGKQGETT